MFISPKLHPKAGTKTTLKETLKLMMLQAQWMGARMTEEVRRHQTGRKGVRKQEITST
jgi:hypothetical protein